MWSLGPYVLVSVPAPHFECAGSQQVLTNALVVRSLRTSQTLALFCFAAEVYKHFSQIFVWLGTISWFAT